MKLIIVGVIAAIGLFALGESLTCNKCPVGLVGFCLFPSTTVCTTNTSSCFTGKASFPNISSFVGFNSQGCLESAQCNTTTTGSILGASYTVTQTCCSSDKCNPITISSAAPYVQLSLTTALSAALLAFA